MTRRQLIVTCLALTVGLLAGGLYFYLRPTTPTTPPTKRITPTTTLHIGDHQFNTAVARTPAETQQGLAGITSLHADEAMYFIFNQQANVTFWMKGMYIPIDILWVDDGKIAGIEANVPPPIPDTPDTNLTRYPSPTNTLDGVIELRGGQSQLLKIKPGDPVAIQL